jgi:hypothetical protein
MAGKKNKERKRERERRERERERKNEICQGKDLHVPTYLYLIDKIYIGRKFWQRYTLL